PQAHADQVIPAVVTATSAPHTLAACAAALLEQCLPEVRERFEDAAPRLEWTLDLLVVTALNEYVQHLDQCPHSPAGPGGQEVQAYRPHVARHIRAAATIVRR